MYPYDEFLYFRKPLQLVPKKMGESQEQSEERETKFQNAEITISESKTVSEGKAIWELKNWNDPDNFNLLKKHANCIVHVGEDVALRFYFKVENVSLNNESASRTDFESLSLCVSPLFIEKDLSEYGFAVKVCVEYLNENLEGEVSPPNYKTVPETVLSFEGSQHSSELLVLKEFIMLSRRWHFRCSSGPTTEVYEKPETIRYGITVEFIKCNEASDTTTKLLRKKREVSGEDAPEKGNKVELSICRDFESMYAQEDNYSDIQLESKDGVVVAAHKFVLAARSTKLREMIEEETKKEDFCGVMKMQDLDAKPLNIMLTWMYTGKLDEGGIQPENLEDLIVAAENYGLDQLLKLCEKKVISVCNVMNMLNLFQLAQKYGLMNAMKKISLFIKENIDEVATPTHA